MSIEKTFEIHQGEWTYITEDDSIEILVTANVAQCTVFCGRASNGFSFMFHIDLPTRKRFKTLTSFEAVLKAHVPIGSRIEYHITGGWKCARWSAVVRNRVIQFMTDLKGYEIRKQDHKHTDEIEKYLTNYWTKGVSFDVHSGEIGSYSIETQTKRKRSAKACFPVFEMPLVRPVNRI